jgi:hypothetical protein
LKEEKMRSKELQLDEIMEKQEGSLTCKAKDIGLDDYLVCLENSTEGMMCAHRFAFGFDYLCASPERIEKMRGSRG